jgi:hypothetical protein
MPTRLRDETGGLWVQAWNIDLQPTPDCAP